MDGIVTKFNQIKIELPKTKAEKSSEGLFKSLSDRKAFCKAHHYDMAPEMSSTEANGTTSNGRPKRSCRDNANAAMQRMTNSHRTIMKNKSLKLDPTATKLADITKIYTKQTLKKFRPVNLETVFEVAEEEEDGNEEAAATALQNFNDLRQQVSLVGAKKFRRSITCRDGANTNKTLQKKRRDKIKRNQLPRHRKIPMDSFLSHLKSLELCDSDSDDDGVARLQPDEAAADRNELQQCNGGGEAMEITETEAHTFAEQLLVNLQKFANAKPPTDPTETL